MPSARDRKEDRKRQFALWAVQRLREAGYIALWAGGCVRDLLMGRTPQDYDVATNATPDEVRRVFGRRRTLEVGASFGVIVVVGPPEVGKLEVATFRTEGPYLDGRHPAHVAFATPEEDARRRDFTINGMFYDPIEEKVLDYVGGQEDLRQRIVRAIGDPEARMREDKLRLLRAVRFTAVLDFQLDPATAAAVRRLCREIRVVSVERIAQELRRMLVDEHRRRAIELCHELGLLCEILPELKPVVPEQTITADREPSSPDVDAEVRNAEASGDEWLKTLRMLAELKNPSFELAFATLVQAIPDCDDVRAVCRRLRFSNEETDTVVWLLRNRPRLSEAPSLSLADLKRLLADPRRDELMELTRVTLLARDADLEPVEFCRRYLQQTPEERLDPPPLITGEDLIAAGLQPGPQFGRLLRAVREAQLNETIQSRDEALQLIERLQSPSGDGASSQKDP